MLVRKTDANEGHDDALLDQFLAQGMDRVEDQLAAIVGRNDAHALGQ